MIKSRMKLHVQGIEIKALSGISVEGPYPGQAVREALKTGEPICFPMKRIPGDPVQQYLEDAHARGSTEVFMWNGIEFEGRVIGFERLPDPAYALVEIEVIGVELPPAASDYEATG